jgi:hypothetical protein
MEARGLKRLVFMGEQFRPCHMKTKILSILLAVASASAAAQTSNSDVISREPSTTSSSEDSSTVRSGDSSYSLSQIAGQLSELSRVVDETLPMLIAATENATNMSAAAPASGGGLAGVLGTILRGNTNQAAGSTSGRNTTNVWGNILRGVLGTNATASASTSTTLNDLVALRAHLESLKPVLDRLDSGDSSGSDLTPTGRDRNTSEQRSDTDED